MSDAPRPARTRLATRFLVYYALTYVVLIGLMGVIIERSTREALVGDLVESLEQRARLAAESLPEDPSRVGEWAASASQAGDVRVTLIELDGTVLADSHGVPEAMENHGSRPEVLLALSGSVGTASRISVSTGFEQLYVALPPDDGRLVRVSVPTIAIGEELGAVRSSILAVATAMGLLGVAVVALLARRMARPIAELTEQSLAVAEGDLDVSPRRSRVLELDQLGLAISRVAADIGARLGEAEQASETLEVVLGAIPQGTVLVGPDDSIVYANPSAYELLGSIPDQLGSLAPFSLQDSVRRARDGRHPETRIIDHGKPIRRLRAVATPFLEDDRVLLVVVDVTERERSDTIRRDFVANASHELKTPVSTIVASSEALQIGVERGDPSVGAFARQIEASARQLDRLVADLLDLSRLERDIPETSPTRIDLVVADEVERVRQRAEQKSIELGLEASPMTIPASHRDIAIAVRNLLDNALRYTGEGGSVIVEVRDEGDHAVVSVEDSGEGIPTRELERVFERFYRVDSARSRATGGTGLGLAIVKHVADSHGGTVEVRSELGVGSVFSMRIPKDVENDPGGGPPGQPGARH